MKRALLALPVLLFVAASSAMAAETRIELFRNRLFIPVSVNGTRVTALLDSAAEMSVIDDTLARRLRLRLGSDQAVNGSGGAEKGRFAHGVSLSAAGLRLPHMTAVVLDLRDLSQRLVGRPVTLILGREIFDSARLRIDLARGTIAAVPRTVQPGGERYTLVTAHGVENFPVSVEGGPPVRAEFDLGNGSEVLVGKAYAEQTGLLAPKRIVGRSDGGGIGGKVSRDIVVLKSLTVGGRTFENVRAAIDATGTAGDVNVGTSILRHFVITTDFPQRTLWLEPRT
ncbi:MAG TPA: retropepsin-like aspartic protease [Allosphingosinicella sp.]|jgi:predicted aspartyl protease